MSVFDDPRGKLHWLEEELLEDDDDFEEDEAYDEECEDEEEEYGGVFRPRRSHARNFRHTVYADEAPVTDRDAVFVEKEKRKGTGGLKFLAFLEMLGILAVIWWWIKWLY